MSKFDDWLNSLNLDTANARHIDDDADGSFDCVDVAEDWCKFLWPDVPVNQILGYGNAKDLYANSSDQYFDKLGADITAQPGDIPVWGATPTNSYGHIAVCINDDGTNLTDVEQNTYTQEAATIAHRSHNNLIGFLRPKIEEADMPNIVDDNRLEDLSILALGRSAINPRDPNLNNLIGWNEDDAVRYFIKLPEHQQLLDRAAAYQGLVDKVAELSAKLNQPAPAPAPAVETVPSEPVSDPAPTAQKQTPPKTQNTTDFRGWIALVRKWFGLKK